MLICASLVKRLGTCIRIPALDDGASLLRPGSCTSTGLLWPKAVPADAHDARRRAGSVTADDAHAARLLGYSGRRPFLLMLMMLASGLEASQLMMLMMRVYGATPAGGRSC